MVGKWIFERQVFATKSVGFKSESLPTDAWHPSPFTLGEYLAPWIVRRAIGDAMVVGISEFEKYISKKCYIIFFKKSLLFFNLHSIILETCYFYLIIESFSSW